jgi:hypothetical protein
VTLQLWLSLGVVGIGMILIGAFWLAEENRKVTDLAQDEPPAAPLPTEDGQRLTLPSAFRPSSRHSLDDAQLHPGETTARLGDPMARAQRAQRWQDLDKS